MKSKTVASLPDSIFSPQDLATVILEIKHYARWAAHAAIKLRLDQKVGSQPPALSPAANELLHLHSWANQKAFDAHSCDQLIDELSHTKTTAPIITITLAAPPTKSAKVSLVSWCRQNIAPNVLVNFQFNTSLLGGMVVRFGSHMYDWSFRRQILDNRGKFAEVLRRV